MRSVLLRALAPRAAAAPVASLRPLASRALSTKATPQKLIPAEEMPVALRRRVAALESLHAKFENLEEEHHARLRDLEAAFHAETAELFARRNSIVAGDEEPSDDEVNESAYYAEFEEAVREGAFPEPAEMETSGVPAFWPTALRQSEIPEAIQVSDADWEILDHLVSIRSEPWEPEGPELSELGEGWEMSMGEPGFALHFNFAPNPYLETLELSLYCNGDYEVMEATPPIWVDESADPTVKLVTKKLRKKGGGVSQKKVVPKPTESFFRIFETPEYSDMDDGAEEEPSTDGPMQLTQLQGEVLIRLKEDVIPRAAIHYITHLHHGDMDLEDGELFDDGGYDDDDWEPGPKHGGKAKRH